MNLLLVGNYILDGQHSMIGFAALMEDGLRRAGHQVRTLHPPVVFGRFGRSLPRMLKWFAYVDKLALFPPLFRRAARNVDLVHICDHSNALYIRKRKPVPHVVTCHDLLAVRGSLGEQTDCPASGLGKWLQRWILRGLVRADAVACVSTTTLTDVNRLLPGYRPTEVLPLGLRYDLEPLVERECSERLKAVNGLSLNKQFLLHVGSSQPRKNREGALRVFARVVDKLDTQLVFAGKPLTGAQRDLAGQLKIADRVVEAGEVSSGLLAALYGRALAFFFPSRFEGFGWPIIEAQSCGCPVICSNRGPFPEVAGDAAMMRDVEDEEGFAEDIVNLSSDAKLRAELIEKGFQNALRYKPETMISKYVSFYQQVLNVKEESCASAKLAQA